MDDDLRKIDLPKGIVERLLFGILTLLMAPLMGAATIALWNYKPIETADRVFKAIAMEFT